MSLIVVTPTGDRPDAIKLCQKYIERQTIKPDSWIVVDDGKEETEIQTDLNLVYTRREPKAMHTLAQNMKEAFKFIDDDSFVIIMEDDDWYAPNYIEYMLQGLDQYELFGQGQTLLYNFPEAKYHQLKNMNHASFCKTGFHSSLIPLFYNIDSAFLDLEIWKHNVTKMIVPNDNLIHIGIKGLPGRHGITKGHYTDDTFEKDDDYNFLIHLIGDDISGYEDIMPKLEIPDVLFGTKIRRSFDDSIWIHSPNHQLEQYLDRVCERVRGELRWHII